MLVVNRLQELKIEFEEISGITCAPGATVRISYTLTGAGVNTELQCITNNNWKARFEMFDSLSGYLVVTAPDPMTDGKVLVFVCSGDGRTYMTALSFVEGKPMLDQKKYNIDFNGGQLVLAARTREDITVKIPSSASWITMATDEETKAAERIEDIVLNIAANNYRSTRSAIVELYNSMDEKLSSVEIFQSGNNTGSAYIEFADINVKSICVANFDTNKDGELSFDEAAAVTSIGTIFRSKTSIVSFMELSYFTGIDEIPDNAFSGCSSLLKIALPQNVTSLGFRALENTKITELNIPEGVTSIDDSCFSGCTYLSQINLPNSLFHIGNNCFYGCSALKAIIIPDIMLTLHEGSEFTHCPSLETVVIGSGMLRINDRAFLTSSSSGSSYTQNIKYVVMKAVNPPMISIGGSTRLTYFLGSNIVSIKVPAESVEAYKNDQYWKVYADKIVNEE